MAASGDIMSAERRIDNELSMQENSEYVRITLASNYKPYTPNIIITRFFGNNCYNGLAIIISLPSCYRFRYI